MLDALVLVAALTSQRTYHTVPLEHVATTRQTHICTVGPVVYARRQRDGDWHVTLARGDTKVVVEIIPLIPVPVPRKGQRVQVCGITRRDRHHGWAEIHPVERLTILGGAQ